MKTFKKDQESLERAYDIVQSLKKEEIDKCAQIAEELLSRYESADEVPAWAVKEAIRKAFNFQEGSHERVISDLADDVFTFMHEKD
jgi:phosphopantetheinyl transferase (holo-ACP synthase)